MDRLFFITTNARKIASLQDLFDRHGIKTRIESADIDIIEPQQSSVKAVSLHKAQQAYEKIRAPLITEDGGVEIEALNGFPGAYLKYTLETIGIDGILKLMEGQENRRSRFVSTTTYMDKDGHAHQFDRLGGGGKIALQKSDVHSPHAWSAFWSIFTVPELGKPLCEMNEQELHTIWNRVDQKMSIAVFTEWFAMHPNPSPLAGEGALRSLEKAKQGG